MGKYKDYRENPCGINEWFMINWKSNKNIDLDNNGVKDSEKHSKAWIDENKRKFNIEIVGIIQDWVEENDLKTSPAMEAELAQRITDFIM